MESKKISVGLTQKEWATVRRVLKERINQEIHHSTDKNAGLLILRLQGIVRCISSAAARW